MCFIKIRVPDEARPRAACSSDLVGRPGSPRGSGDHTPGSSLSAPETAPLGSQGHLGGGGGWGWPPYLSRCWPILLEYGRKRCWAQLLSITACLPSFSSLAFSSSFYLLGQQCFGIHSAGGWALTWGLYFSALHGGGGVVHNHKGDKILTQAPHFGGMLLKRLLAAAVCSSGRGTEDRGYRGAAQAAEFPSPSCVHRASGAIWTPLHGNSRSLGLQRQCLRSLSLWCGPQTCQLFPEMVWGAESVGRPCLRTPTPPKRGYSFP